MMDENTQQIISHNKKAWNRQVEIGCRWTVAVSKEEIMQARTQPPKIYLSSGSPIPESWVTPLKDKRVLLLAGGGGQQSLLLSAFGCDVTVADLSEKQLEMDTKGAQENGLEVKVECCDAADMAAFKDESFDFILNPVSNCFFPELKPVWKECFRTLSPGGEIMVSFVNPHSYMFDFELANKGTYQIKYAIPYSDSESLDEQEKKRFLSNDSPLEFSHSFDSQIGDLLSSGFQLIELFSDRDKEIYENGNYMANYYNYRAVKV
jgi:SAM-dependent methyltransferase